MSALDALLKYASDGIEPGFMPEPPSGYGLNADLRQLLSRRNGFYALSDALHVLPRRSDAHQAWDDPRSWQDAYGSLAVDCHFFAHDVFGNPFAIRDEAIVLFDAETGAAEHLGNTLEQWADAVLTNSYWTGANLAQSWRSVHGSLSRGRRLVPRRLFVVGGTYDLDNLYSGVQVESLRFRAHVAQQLKDLPDGTPVQFRLSE